MVLLQPDEEVKDGLVALVEMQALNLKKSKTHSHLTFRQVYFKGLFGSSFFCWASFVDLLTCFSIDLLFVVVVLLLLCFLLWGKFRQNWRDHLSAPLLPV